MKLNRARKRQLRVSVRKIVADTVAAIDSKHFDAVSETEEEALYVERFKADFVAGLTVNNGSDGDETPAE